ncbi:MAG TPA: hypothetical protein RMH85_18270 [Polyangiaceae bacterium LLY-WYZ-15_(1-7)]|nr:hypothetical protein [Myxococcales bacterium]MAT24263.1 hypothetical protein [Sandaracinus sp.]HJK89304.1 hypothetical protein [Polyangiaceae bacterium LLY-WYZ-15_(1-7)]MBJ74220.1 hypothetical protein [Sandaracinus sp.]HJL04233.1 hypothetical protein [Polyangiaceae bacterium LLY-WYZ-15_(1-7)]
MLFGALLGPARSAHAQEGSRRAAAQAFEAGQRAQLEGEYARAAQLFELAHRTAPAAAAIRSAIRNHRAAGNAARAATLSIEALRTYAADSATRQLAQETLDEAEGTLARLDVRCGAPCGVLIDGEVATLRAAVASELFVAPGERTVRAEFDGGGFQEATVQAAVGEVARVSLEAPAAPVSVEPESGAPGEGEPDEVAPDEDGGADEVDEADAEPGAFRREPLHLERPSRVGLDPAYTWIGLGLTAGFGAVLVWSLVDLLEAHDEYEVNPTRERWERGQDRIRRTWILGVSTGVLAISTLLVATLGTDWEGRDDAHPAASAWLGPGGGGVTLSGRFGGGG